MVRLIVILIVTDAFLSGCQSDYERDVDAARATILRATQHDWKNEIPVLELIQADQLCKKYGPLNECSAVDVQMTDITVSLSSCRNDMRSNLCKKLFALFEKSQFAYLMTVSTPIALPDSPWYWSLPTRMLNELADQFDYRTEVTHWWWGKWRLLILSCVAAFCLLGGAWTCWKYWKRLNETRLERLAEQTEKLIEQKRSRQALIARLQAEARARADAESQKLILEQQRIAAAKLAEERAAQRKAEEKAMQDKLALEQTEARKLLQAVSQYTKKPTRRKHDSSST